MTDQGLAARILYDGLKPEDFRIYQLTLSDSIRGDAAFWRILKCSGLAARLFALCLREKDLIIIMMLSACLSCYATIRQAFACYRASRRYARLRTGYAVREK